MDKGAMELTPRDAGVVDLEAGQHDEEEQHDDSCCPVCLIVPKDAVAGPCGHSVCVPCMERILLGKPPLQPTYNPDRDQDAHLLAPTLGRCPICRAELSLFNLKNQDEAVSLPFVEKNYDVQDSPIAGLSYVGQEQQSFSIHFPRASAMTSSTVRVDSHGRPLTHIKFGRRGANLEEGSNCKYFQEGCHYHNESRTFHGEIGWDQACSQAGVEGPENWKFIMEFSSDFDYVSGGTLVKERSIQQSLQEDAEGEDAQVQVFGHHRGLVYHRANADGTRTTPLRIPISEPKMGSKCCGCCCDMLRATVIVNNINIVLNVFGVIYAISNGANVGDESADDVLRDLYRDQAIIAGVGILVLVPVIFGTVLFNIFAVAMGVVWYVASYAAGTVLLFIAYNDYDEKYEGDDEVSSPFSSAVIGLVLTALFIYPHLGLMAELRTGIMTRETYPREEFSCCCT